MNEAALSAKQLGKKFLLTEKRPTTLREAINKSMGRKYRLNRSNSDNDPGVTWALKDISFDIFKGDVVGLIGNNGAGKSVLLKILCGITTPSEGVAEIRGRIGALLELGTGFHPDLSGRDNIYLNASVLGINREEIADKVEEIIEFSGIDYAIDEPVKYYSTGMSMRLAFSIAVTLEPEIILLDEVWAVGDSDFQKKGMAKMQELIAGKTGQRTVVLVSHSMSTIASACTRCILLEHGRIRAQGSPEIVIKEYLSARTSIYAVESEPSVASQPTQLTEEQKDEITSENSAKPMESKSSEIEETKPASPRFVSGHWIWKNADCAPGNESIRLRSVRLSNPEGQVTDRFFIGEAITFELTVDMEEREKKYVFGFAVKDLYGSFILASSSEATDMRTDNSLAGTVSMRVVCTIPGGIICSMTYNLVLIIGTQENFSGTPDILLEDLVTFDMLPRHYDNRYPLNLSGAMPLNLQWSFEQASAQSFPDMLSDDIPLSAVD